MGTNHLLTLEIFTTDLVLFLFIPFMCESDRTWTIFVKFESLFYYHLQNQTSSSLNFRAVLQKTCSLSDRNTNKKKTYPKKTDFTVSVYWSIHKAHKQMEAIAIMQIRHLCFYCKYTAYLLPQGHGKRQSDKASKNLRLQENLT